MLDHVIWKFFVSRQRTFLVRSRDISSLSTGAELLCSSRDERSSYECICFNISYTLWDFEKVALLLVACEIRKRRACEMNEQKVNWIIQHVKTFMRSVFSQTSFLIQWIKASSSSNHSSLLWFRFFVQTLLRVFSETDQLYHVWVRDVISSISATHRRRRTHQSAYRR